LDEIDKKKAKRIKAMESDDDDDEGIKVAFIINLLV